MLNAFRRRRFHHYRRAVFTGRVNLCSTPSGVEGSITLPHPLQRPCLPGVLNAFRRRRFHHEPGAARRRRAIRVLNAFRRRRFHHKLILRKAFGDSKKCSTPSGVEGSITAPARSAPASHSCAQRLPASKVPSRHRRRNARLTADVLNAFRRRRFHHGGGWGGTFEKLGAQRLPASKVPSRGASPRVTRAGPDVLNAFRRRRFHHNLPRPDGVRCRLCSTPSGVEGSITAGVEASWRSRSCAQRLPASKVPSLGRRGHDQSPYVRCAQRLPASKVPSRATAGQM